MCKDKIQVRAIFHIRDIRRNVLTQIDRDFYGDAILVPIQIRASR